jgi:hypothetical protein
MVGWAQWFTRVILATQEAEIRKIVVEIWQDLSQTISQVSS